MSVSYYEQLKETRRKTREWIDREMPGPRQTKGFMLPVITGKRTKPQLYQDAVVMHTRVAMTLLAAMSKEIGWDAFLAGLEKWQGPVVSKKAFELMKETGYDGTSAMDVRLMSMVWATGCGFGTVENGAGFFELSHDLVQTGAGQCPQIDALEYMGLDHKNTNLSNWCDAYDYFIVHPQNPKIGYTHAACLGRGDATCRAIIEVLDEKEDIANYHRDEENLIDAVDITDVAADKAKQESLYDKITRLKEKYREERADELFVRPNVAGFQAGREIEDLSPEEIGKRGTARKYSIAAQTLLASAKMIGWERLINLLKEVQSEGLKKAAEERKEFYEIEGDTYRDAGALYALGYAGFPFYDHQLVEYTDERVEMVSHSCPLVDHAKEMDLNHEEDLSLWCDFYHNFNVQAANKNCQLVHTHCLGKGDKICRSVIVEKEQ